MPRSRPAALCVALLARAVLAQSAPPPSPPPAPPPCAAPEYRQFDFWIGDWNVYGPDGSLAGTNDVTRELDGCVLQEHWVAAGPPPQRGSSFNTWERSRDGGVTWAVVFDGTYVRKK